MKISAINLSSLFDIKNTEPDENSRYEIITISDLEKMLERLTEEYMNKHGKVKNKALFFSILPYICLIIQFIGLLVSGIAMFFNLMSITQERFINIGLLILVLTSIFICRKYGRKLDKKIGKDIISYVKHKKLELYSVSIFLEDARNASYQTIVDILKDNNIDFSTKTEGIRDSIETAKKMIEQTAINLEENGLQIWCLKK